jgi:predicted component of type VI protein secretion system
MRLTLTLFDPTALMGGPTVSRRFAATGGTIGRAADNDWVLADQHGHLSDNHCRVEWRDGRYVLVDTSTTGVYLNESPEALGFGNGAALSAGDRIALGDYLIAVALDDGAAPAAAADVAGPDRPAPLPEPPREAGGGDDATAAPVPEPRALPEDRLPTSAPHAARAVPPSGDADLLTVAPPPRPARLARGARTANRSNEFAAAFLGAAGVSAPDLTREQTLQVMARAGTALREAVAGLHDVLRKRTGLPDHERLVGSRLGTSDDNPVTDAADGDEAVVNLLGIVAPPRLAPRRAIREVIAGLEVADPAPARRFDRLAPAAAIIMLAALGLAGAAAYHALGPGPHPAGAARPPVETAAVAPAPLPPVAPAASPPTVAVDPAPPAPPPAPPLAPVTAAPPAPVTTVAPPPSLDRPRLRATLAQIFRGFVCADLGAEIAADGTVTLTGFVSRGDDLARLHREISSTPQVARVDSRATVEPWPFCEVSKLLRVQTAGGAGAPQLEASHADHVYREGDALIVSATAPDSADGFLYVDFFDTDGKVVHMLPTALRPNNRVTANERVTLGVEPGKAGRSDRVYIISPPFGTGLVVALASQRPLFAEPRPEQEDAGGYLAALAGALVRDPVGAGSAARIASGQQSIILVAR